MWSLLWAGIGSPDDGACGAGWSDFSSVDVESGLECAYVPGNGAIDVVGVGARGGSLRVCGPGFVLPGCKL